MFSSSTYTERRRQLCAALGSGRVLLLGNGETGMNYAANVYHFRQDSTFLYFIGIDQPGLAAVIDTATGGTTVFGDELTMDDIVWTGEQPSIRRKAAQAGIDSFQPRGELSAAVDGETHYLPPYRGAQVIALQALFGRDPESVQAQASEALIRATVQVRTPKSEVEIAEIETAVRITNEMHRAAMQTARPGVRESEVYAALMGVAHRHDTHYSFPAIVSRDGQILHNHAHKNVLAEGDLLLVDCGAESPLHYAGDMTRTFPVSAQFSDRQKAVYEVCLQSQLDAISALRPGITYREVHLIACRTIALGLKELGIMRGDVEAAVEAGAHALFFPHGLGHLMGLDVHDMENLGEAYVGYTDDLRKSTQFGLAFLRLGRTLAPGMVLTVEPGIYFIPQLIDAWRAEGKWAAFIDFDEADKFKDFGGIRIEDDYLITAEGARLLGDPVPKTVKDIEDYRAQL
ncbi:MAG: aminopeptidase P family protein [Bacteroidota bacterium]